MKRLSVALLILCSCASEPGQYNPSVDPVPLKFGGTRSAAAVDDAGLTEFHYLTYDHETGNWSGEFGGLALPDDESPGTFLPADASRVYWPEGKNYSFYAAGYNSNVSVGEDDVEFGTSMMLYSSGTSALLVLKNPGHNVDWMAAKTLRQEKIRGIPLNFRHIAARVRTVSFDLSEYLDWIRDRELDIADIKLVTLDMTDADEQNYVFSPESGSLFTRQSYDYGSSASHMLMQDRMLGLVRGGDAFDVSYYAFAGIHSIALRVQTVDESGRQVIDDRSFSASLTLPMGGDCEIRIKILPDDRDLHLEVTFGIEDWQSGGSGTVNE